MTTNDPFTALLQSTHDEALWTQGHFNASPPEVDRAYWQVRYERLAVRLRRSGAGGKGGDPMERVGL